MAAVGCDAVEAIDGDAHVISGVYAETHRQAADLARAAAAEKADGVLVFPPNLLMFDASREVGYTASLKSPLPQICRSWFSRTSLDRDALRRAVDGPDL